MLQTIEKNPNLPPVATVIWLHGLGADGHDFEPVVPMFGLPANLPVRFVFPHAPKRPVTLNMGMTMRAWYDIIEIGANARQDEAGIRDSARLITALIERENERGIPSQKICLAGFSQGGAMALHVGLRHPEPLAGLIALSCYLPLAGSAKAELAGKQPASLPIFMGHGLYDPMVPAAIGTWSADQLRQLGFQPQWHTYPIEHSVHPDEIEEIGIWLKDVFS